MESLTPRLTAKEKHLVDIWCRRVRHLIELREHAYNEDDDSFDRDLLACITNERLQFSELDALIDMADERALAYCVVWLTAVFEKARAARAAFSKNMDPVVNQTVEVLRMGGILAASPRVVRSILGHEDVLDSIFIKGGAQNAALIATCYLAQELLPIRHNASKRWLQNVLSRVRAGAGMADVLEYFRRKGSRAW